MRLLHFMWRLSQSTLTRTNSISVSVQRQEVWIWRRELRFQCTTCQMDPTKLGYVSSMVDSVSTLSDHRHGLVICSLRYLVAGPFCWYLHITCEWGFDFELSSSPFIKKGRVCCLPLFHGNSQSQLMDAIWAVHNHMFFTDYRESSHLPIWGGGEKGWMLNLTHQTRVPWALGGRFVNVGGEGPVLRLVRQIQIHRPCCVSVVMINGRLTLVSGASSHPENVNNRALDFYLVHLIENVCYSMPIFVTSPLVLGC